MLVNQIGRFYGVYVFVVLEGGEKGFEITNQIERETKPGRFVVEVQSTFFWVFGVWVFHFLRRVALAMGYVTI